MLQKEGKEIELISDEEIYRFVQKALRVSFFTNIFSSELAHHYYP